ncbi:hypothetical protein LSH36_654g01068 [Paralvinella palmiformis]|uniref:CWH43-like N-terminal domain-containing protein n=1 Tax=Paralvinella palmiformis TaxID=53620 RepID=A0AAD9J3T1_9ANNE|nr:hypothetical protein LSH36_654g01068 [Paralvinella palmiformis]
MADDSYSVHWIPVIVFIGVPLTFLTTFAIAVSLGHVEADFPYISDTGTKSPESCIFGQLLNLAALLIGLNIYVRYKQIEHHLSHHNNIKLQRANHVSLYIGLIAAFGMSMVGNFQETNVLVVHLIGAILAFGIGGVYGTIHVVISYKCHPHLTSLRICHLRAVLCAVIFITFIANAISKRYFHGNDPRKWYPKDGGFTYHVISTASEWIMASSLLVYFVTFYSEFRHLRMAPPRVVVVELSNSGLVGDTVDDVPILS